MMRNLLAPENVQQTKRYTIVAICGLALLSISIREIFGTNGYMARRRRRIQIQALSAEIQKLKQEKVLLTDRIQDLRSDPQAIEKLAREQLRLGRPGDVVITLAPPNSPSEPRP
ncbi:MAG: septum formation initiator family protein [Acidobacteria bacterium]|nr:septum formation initiator family protein [Acidobacteriota bacterium]